MNKLTARKRSQNQEKSVAKQFNAKETIASGSKWGMKSDVRGTNYLIECKTTEKTYYSLTANVWEKVSWESTRDHLRIPLMVIDLEDKHRIVVFNPNDFNLGVPQMTFKANKSARISHKELGRDSFGEYTYMKSIEICGKKRNLLCYMLVEDFNNLFRLEELWD